jgi:hypothetical protein
MTTPTVPGRAWDYDMGEFESKPRSAVPAGDP